MESQERRMDRTKTEPVASVQQEPELGERIQKGVIADCARPKDADTGLTYQNGTENECESSI